MFKHTSPRLGLTMDRIPKDAAQGRWECIPLTCGLSQSGTALEVATLSSAWARFRRAAQPPKLSIRLSQPRTSLPWNWYWRSNKPSPDWDRLWDRLPRHAAQDRGECIPLTCSLSQSGTTLEVTAFSSAWIRTPRNAQLHKQKRRQSQTGTDSPPPY